MAEGGGTAVTLGAFIYAVNAAEVYEVIPQDSSEDEYPPLADIFGNVEASLGGLSAFVPDFVWALPDVLDPQGGEEGEGGAAPFNPLDNTNPLGGLLGGIFGGSGILGNNFQDDDDDEDDPEEEEVVEQSEGFNWMNVFSPLNGLFP